MLTRRAMLASSAACLAATAAGRLQAATGLANLGALAEKRGILFGTATSTYQLHDPDFAPLLARQVRILVPEYEMKRGLIEERPGIYDFRATDALVDFARAQGMAFRGHPLVWHKRNPDWLDTALASSPKDSLLTGYIEALAGHYRGRMHSWDVVNEALALDGTDLYRETPWLKAFGPSYIDIAYHTARAADPQALLVYNDWGCEIAPNDAFRAKTLNFLEGALKRGVPIQAYGMQGHLAAFGHGVDQKKLASFLESVRAVGLRILITEHDVDDSGGTLDIATRDRAVADISRRFFDVVLDNPATIAVLTWGLSDRFLDPPGWRDSLRGYSPRMLPLDRNLQTKPMWDALEAAFAGKLRLTSD
jgi:endo-1,4-beta-xylanase